MANRYKVGDAGQELVDMMNEDSAEIESKAAGSHTHVGGAGGDTTIIESTDIPTASGNVIATILPTLKRIQLTDADGKSLGLFVNEKLAVLAAQTGGLIAIPGSGSTNGKPSALTTSYTTLHQVDPPAGFADLYALMASSVDADVIVSVSLDGGTTLHGYTEIEETNGGYLIAQGLMDPSAATNLQMKADASSDAFGWINVLRVPLSSDGSEPGFVLPSGANKAGFVLPTTAGVTVHQSGASSGFVDVIDLYVVTRTANDVIVTLNDGSNDFLNRTVPGGSWQKLLSRHILNGTTTLTAKADMNGYATLMAIIKRMPTS